jgi:hypothetical protein
VALGPATVARRTHAATALESASEGSRIFKPHGSCNIVDGSCWHEQATSRFINSEAFYEGCGANVERLPKKTTKMPRTQTGPFRKRFNRQIFIQMGANPGR